MPASRIFPPNAHAVHRIDPTLLRTLAEAMDAVQRLSGRRATRAGALAQLGDIDLPDTAPTHEDAQRLEVAAPLYLANELEQAGLLRTAELIAGLFASGAITQPLGPTAQLISDFWRARRERLSEIERQQLFAQVFDLQGFYPLMHALCVALSDQLDSPPRASDVHARVVLHEAADALGGWLAPRAVGMAAFAAQDIVQALSQATRFLRDRLLLTAFGAHDLWGLLGSVGNTQGLGTTLIRERVDLGRQGSTVLAWLAGAVPFGYAFDRASPQGQQLMAAAYAWRISWERVGGATTAGTGSPQAMTDVGLPALA